MQTYLSYTVSRVSNGPFIPVISWPEGGIAQHCTVVVASDSGAYTCQSRAEHATTCAVSNLTLRLARLPASAVFPCH